jgi:energy-coupling factor transporter ATP-binding protein EcfA2
MLLASLSNDCLKFQTEGPKDVRLTSSGQIFTVLRLSPIDLEEVGVGGTYELLNQLVKSMKPKWIYKLYLSSKFSDECALASERSAEISKIGHIQYSAFLAVESAWYSFGDLKKIFSKGNAEASKINQIKTHLKELEAIRSDLNASEVSYEEFLKDALSFSPEVADLTSSDSLLCEDKLIGVARLGDLSAESFEISALGLLKDQLEPPYTLALTISPNSRELSEAMLRLKSGRNKAGESLAESNQHLEAEKGLESVITGEERVFRISFTGLFSRLNLEDLRRSLSETIRALAPIGKFEKEVFGLKPLVKATLPGGGFHVPLQEMESNIPFLMPLISQGVAQASCQKGVLVLHRRDDSLDTVNLFDAINDNFSACIFGKSGSGKSVLTNLLTRALHNASDIEIIKVDVGGSHSKETRQLGGSEFRLSLDKPSGINPFRLAAEVKDQEVAVGVLVNLLSTLITENNEVEVSKSIKAELEKSLSCYMEKRPQSPSLSGLLKSQDQVPRRELLERWGDKGVFKNAFRETAEQSTDSKLLYFNFSEIFQASDPDFGQGGLAAVMAYFNFKMMQAKEKRVVFIADETPFFINKCFPFFKFSTANVRKFGGSFITIAQKSSDVVVGGDHGILENSQSKFLFSIDGSESEFKESLRLSLEGVEKIKGLQKSNGQFSEVLMSNGRFEKTFRIRLSKKSIGI